MDHAGSGRRFDRLPLREWQQAFLDQWGWTAPVPAPPATLAALRDLRLRLRRLLEGAPGGTGLEPSEIRHLNALLLAAPFVYTIADGQVVVAVPVRRDWDWVVAEVVRSTVDLVTRFERRRIKVCANPDCNWLFYDGSLNRSRRWCQTGVCGNLVKVREHRARRQGRVRG